MIKLATICSALLIASCSTDDNLATDRTDPKYGNDRQAITKQNVNTENTQNASPSKKVADYYAHIKPKHRKVLRSWLATKPYLRPAVEEIDNPNFRQGSESDIKEYEKSVRDTVGRNGYQYYSIADMNYDGKEDFATLLVDNREYDDEYDYFALAIFNAPFEVENAPAYYTEKLIGISYVYIVFDGMAKNHLYFGKFESDVYCSTFYPKGKTYYFKGCLDE